MSIGRWLQLAVTKLAQAGIDTARLDALVLLEDVLKKDRAWLLAHQETEIVSNDVIALDKLLTKRVRHIPLAYVRGKSEFYGRTFLITPDVLEPRPESEAIIDELLKLSDLPAKPLIADVGTGSGALGITAKLEIPTAVVSLIDIDKKALAVAKSNVDKFTSTCALQMQDMLTGDGSAYDALLCNLPYVPDDYPINAAAAHEPRLAIFGGQDGLELYRRLFAQLDERSDKVLYILTEALPFQRADLAEIAQHNHYELCAENDFIQVFRRVQKQA